MRPILPKSSSPSVVMGGSQGIEFRVPPSRQSIDASSDRSGGSRESPKPKRIVVSNACVPCRKRRSKCDGCHPCGKCRSLERQPECHFDAENDHRRKGALRRENDELKRKNFHLDAIFRSIATSADSELENIVKRIRTGENFEDIAQGIRATSEAVSSGYNTSEPESSTISNLSEADESGGKDHDSDTSPPPPSEPPNPSSWTNVTNDDAFVLELIDLYFTWHHPFFHYFSEHRFRADFASGRTANCSPLLVNAILSSGCHYSDKPEARADPQDDDSVGEHFCREAKRLFEEGGKKRIITTIQALPIIAVRESGCGRDLLGRTYLSLAYRLVCDPSYNTFLVPEQIEKHNIDEEAWRITFWGCYCIETEWNFGMGRPNDPNPVAKIMRKPTPTLETELTPWVPYTGQTPKSMLGHGRPANTYTIFNQVVSLCELMQEISSWLYGGKLFKAGTLVEFHGKLKQWHESLPQELKGLEPDSVPGLFYLHELHRMVLIHLFRPFAHLPFEPSKNMLSPRELATISSRESALVLRKHHRAYGFRRACNMIYQFLLTMCTARQAEFDTLPDARQDYAFGVRGLKEAGIAWPFGKIALLSMVEIRDTPEEKKMPSEEIQGVLGTFEAMTVDQKTELTNESDYYRVIVGNTWVNLAPDFEFHWRHEWAKYMANLRDEGGAHGKGRMGIVKKPSVESLLN